MKKIGKDKVLICSSKSPTNSEFVLCVEYNTKTGKLYVEYFVFSKYKDFAQTTYVCLGIIRLLLKKTVVA